jgi:hypothetical protein
MYIIGFDISTRFVGYCVIEYETEEIVSYNAISLNLSGKTQDLFNRGEVFEFELRKIKEQFPDIQYVYIEEAVKVFQTKRSSANTIAILAKMNSVASWIIYRELGIKPQYIMARTARKICKIKVPKGANAKAKVVEVLMNQNKLEVEYTPGGKVKQHFYDIADAIIIAQAGLDMLMRY